MASALVTLNNVDCKGQGPGTLILYDGFVEWLPSSATGARIAIDLRNVKAQRISPEHKPKVQLQLIMQDGSNTIFIFQNLDGKPGQLADRNIVKECLQNLLPQYRQVTEGQKHSPDSATQPDAGKNQVPLNATPTTNGHLAVADSPAPGLSNHAAKSKHKRHDHYKDKQKLLESNKVLYSLYAQLVTSETITADEFWLHYAPDVINATGHAKSTPFRLIGQANPRLTCIAKLQEFRQTFCSLATSDGCNDIHFSLTQDMMRSIFETYPSIRKKHLELVPAKLTEREFWTEFFKSQYFQQQRAGFPVAPDDVNAAKDPFADCAALDEREYGRMLNAGPSTSSADLGTIYEISLDQEGYGNISLDFLDGGSSEAPQAKAKSLLLRAFNQHSVRVLRASLGDTFKLGAKRRKAAEGGSTQQSDEPAQKIPATSVVDTVPSLPRETESLVSDGPSTSSASNLLLKLQPSNYFYSGAASSSTSEGTTTTVGGSGGASHWPKSDAVRWLTAFQRAVANLSHEPRGQSSSPLLLSEDRWETLSRRFAEEAASGGGATGDDGQAVPVAYPAGDIDEIRGMYHALSELLRHLWACFPITSPLLEQKAKATTEALLNFRKNKLDSHVYRFPHHDLATVQHMYKQVEMAVAKYDNYVIKKRSRAR